MAVTLTVGGQIYTRWISAKVTRSLKRAAAAFEFVTPGELVPQILPFMACTVSDDGDAILTGYVDSVEPTIAARASRTTIRGRSKTADLIDCMVPLTISTNQFNGNTLDAIARAVAKPFGIGVVVGPGADVGAAFPDGTFERSETAFAFLEREARQRGILLTDDAQGNLVLATVGTGNAAAALAMGQGGNVFEAQGRLDGQHRFSQYTVLAQAGKKATGSIVEAGIASATATDAGVPRFRPWVGIAESALLPGDANVRAQWEAAHHAGEAVQATLSVAEWRAGGVLWQVNTLAKCNIPRLALNEQYLIGGLTFADDERGRRTSLLVAPPAAYSPGVLKVKTGTGNMWDGIKPV